MNHSEELLQIIREKQTILILSLDVTNKKHFFRILKKCAPYICGVKLHLELYPFLNRWNLWKLNRLAKKERFIIIEDRKFSDIGNTQYLQAKSIMKKGISYFTSHLITGEKAIRSFPHNVKLFLVADMSCEDAFLSDKIDIQSTLHETAVDYFTKIPQVIGFVSQYNIAKYHYKTPIILRPGVRLNLDGNKGDKMGQRYKNPVVEPGVCWVVGREICNHSNPDEISREYQNLYKKNISKWEVNTYSHISSL